MIAKKHIYTWSASSNDTYMTGKYDAASIRDAVKAARAYILGTFARGEGRYVVYKDGEPVRQEERSIRTGYVWVNKQ